MQDYGNREIFAENLTYQLDLHNMSRKEFCKAMGFPYTTVSGWLKAEKYPRVDRMQKIADYFGIPITELVGEKTKEPSTANEGLTENQRKLIDFAKGLDDAQADKVLKLMQSILAFDK